MKILSTARVAGTASVVLVASAAVAQECMPSKWGAADEIGGANYVTAESVLGALRLVTRGEVHPLGIVVDPNMPAFPPRQMMLQVVQPNQQFGRSLAQDLSWPAVYNDDVAQLWWGIGPQIDGLGHMGESDTFYNCNRGSDFAALTGLEKLGIHNVPPLVGRGVLIDMAKYFGVDVLEGGQAFDADDIQAAAAAQNVDIHAGDIVLFHTGWTAAKLESEPDTWVSTEPGITNDAAVYLASLNPMAVGADTWGVEAIPPAEGDKAFYGHVTFLKENGIYILETMNTGRLAQEGVTEFLFVLGQARLKGAVQMIINPVAMW